MFVFGRFHDLNSCLDFPRLSLAVHNRTENTCYPSQRAAVIINFNELMQPWAFESKLKGTHAPSTEGQSQCDPGLEREV